MSRSRDRNDVRRHHSVVGDRSSRDNRAIGRRKDDEIGTFTSRHRNDTELSSTRTDSAPRTCIGSHGSRVTFTRHTITITRRTIDTNRKARINAFKGICLTPVNGVGTHRDKRVSAGSLICSCDKGSPVSDRLCVRSPDTGFGRGVTGDVDVVFSRGGAPV